ncbi:MAG: DUF4160 domain-containing protein [Bryobacterales bacterium]|nr:DUF4160 domain-containing protein [Bryobacterales bacterium]
MPGLLRVRGYRFFFFSMEEREPPHIHVAHAGRYAKFWLETVSVADVKGFRTHEMTEIRRIVVDNAWFFLEKWHEYFGGKR